MFFSNYNNVNWILYWLLAKNVANFVPPFKEFYNQTDGSVPASFCDFLTLDAWVRRLVYELFVPAPQWPSVLHWRLSNFLSHHLNNSITILMVVSLPAFVHLDSTQLWCLCLWNEWRKKCAQFSCNTQRIHDPPKGVKKYTVVRYLVVSHTS